MTHPLISDEMVEKAQVAANEQVGGPAYDTEWATSGMIRAALESIAPDIWNAAVERCAGEAESVFKGIGMIDLPEKIAFRIRSIKHQPSGKE